MKNFQPPALLFSYLLLSLFTAVDAAALCNSATDPDVTCPEDVVKIFTSIQESAKMADVLDVVFIIDEGALTAPQHYWTKQFLKAFTQLFVISPEYTKNILLFTYQYHLLYITCKHPKTKIFSDLGLNAAIGEFAKGRASADHLTVLITNGGWGNLGSNPESAIATLKSYGHVAAVILKHPNQNIGLIKNVIFDNFVSFFGSTKLGFTVNMAPEYLRALHTYTEYTKSMSTRWPLDMIVNNSKCASSGRSCSNDQSCVCEIRSLQSEYICIGKDMDPPAAVSCDGPNSPIQISPGNISTLVVWEQPVFSDNTGIVRTVSDKLPGLYQAGQHTVVTMATDKHGNTAKCQFSFTVTN
ncbi:hypothetical protein EB796_007899 [Bugula neritina]|uniref:HYR domain-containing protein n=1 Tax=Bugula neritina TaxID=10212 RepID=A0A7J7K6F1_BUGNE|nr:hypothetical protein EB796_007899 [Bugula neritina]